ncbi:1,4-alpha-glucan-branching enzyme 3 [Cucumis melo var. makuwa]|uniref:1,4-alpha-glucan-branching enzyme 3 n=1 Tax=Cucumis melo var. makuwa TaxID=1194695 RepID=A0A5D3DHI6_CUCMM|nr:1,4-alpha-glucan-branching enzyme 3 [Cucumis melo var. makuwa]
MQKQRRYSVDIYMYINKKVFTRKDQNKKCNNNKISNMKIVVISYIRGPFLFIYNFHPTDSFERYSVGVEEAGEYRIMLNTDEIEYGGQGNIKHDQYLQRTISRRIDGLRNCLEVSLPCRTAQENKTGFEVKNDKIMEPYNTNLIQPSTPLPVARTSSEAIRIASDIFLPSIKMHYPEVSSLSPSLFPLSSFLSPPPPSLQLHCRPITLSDRHC